jgi:hypothetical protein
MYIQLSTTSVDWYTWSYTLWSCFEQLFASNDFLQEASISEVNTTCLEFSSSRATDVCMSEQSTLMLAQKNAGGITLTGKVFSVQ